MNAWRQAGEWDFLVCRQPEELGAQIRERIAERNARIDEIAQEVLEESKKEAKRLREQGWTREDFARSLINMLEHG